MNLEETMSLDVTLPLLPLIKLGNIRFDKSDDHHGEGLLLATIYNENWGNTTREVTISNDDSGASQIHFNFGSSAAIRYILMDICAELDIEYLEI
tara:strand:- start:672 stop:956 length:285 start_codon:yes stop_codon:yes gene_type:complete